MRLTLVRHGATANNGEGRYTGQTDVPLSPLGARQAEAVAAALAGERFDAIIASDLQRARATAEAIARRVDAPLAFDADLREIAMGAWEGMTFSAVDREYPRAWEHWRAALDQPAPSGGESVVALRDRAARALGRCLESYPNGRVLWVTHGGFIGVLLCHVLGIGLEHRGQFRRDNTAITELDVRASNPVNAAHADPLPNHGTGQILRLNDTHHLAGLPSKEREQVL